MTMHECTETNPATNSIHSLAAVMDLAILMQQKMADFAKELSEALDRLQNNPSAAGMKPKYPPARRQKQRTASSALSQKEQHIWACVHVQGKTITQSACELGCTTQNVYKHLLNAERKMKAQCSRSVNTRHHLPQDARGQVRVDNES